MLVGVGEGAAASTPEALVYISSALANLFTALPGAKFRNILRKLIPETVEIHQPCLWLL